MTIPDSIDALLMALSGGKGYSPELRKHLDRMAVYVMRAFAGADPDRASIEKAMARGQAGLAAASGQPTESPDRAAVEALGRLLAELQGIAAGGEPQQPTIIRAPTRSLARTQPLPVRLPSESKAVEPESPPAVSKLPGLHARRRSLLADPLATWSDLRAVDAELHVALSAAGEGGTIDHVIGNQRARSDAADADFWAALRLSADVPRLERAAALVSRSGRGERLTVFAALADHGRLSADRLVPLLDDPSDLVAARAAELLAWLGRPPGDTKTVQRRLDRDCSPILRSALLFAAIALGSATALRSLRELVDAGDQAVTSLAVDALAMAGEAGDVARLLALAARQPELSSPAVLAAGHLGSAAVVEAIARARVPRAIIDRAIATTLGSGAVGAADRSAGRCLHGRPWTLSDALERLEAPNELLRSRAWYALEAVVRTGERPPAFHDLQASVDVQERAVTRIRAALVPPPRAFPPAEWLFYGRPVP